ncbi:MAG TPA: NAD-dependent epimerase/dehydratase family protein [Candidatus Dormibacteraeota bacterium]|nr:NAD-dependent epimerase/dehydratase family protein [Candidatus Dormibacteraeota bacterium]
MPPATPSRVLITGVSNPLGAEVARRLAVRVPWLFGCDVDDPVSALEDMDFVHADTRSSVIAKLVRQLKIDTIVHLAVIVDSPRGERATHETNVIGTMNVLGACAGPSSPVRRLVVKSSQAIYGARAGYPSLLSEEFAGLAPVGSPISRDLVELEQLAHDFAVRNPACRVARLRLGFRMNRQTSLGRYLSLPLVPTFAGYDPRLQLLHEDDAAEAIAAAALGTQEGPFNVAGDGVILLSQALGIMAGREAPILPPLGAWLSGIAIRSTTGVNLPAHLVELLMHGCVVDCSRLHTEFGWRPAFSSMAVMDAFAQGLTEEPVESPSPPQEYELQVYLQRRRRGERNGPSPRPLALTR